jgi:hypothetical protein
MMWSSPIHYLFLIQHVNLVVQLFTSSNNNLLIIPSNASLHITKNPHYLHSLSTRMRIDTTAFHNNNNNNNNHHHYNHDEDIVKSVRNKREKIGNDNYFGYQNEEKLENILESVLNQDHTFMSSIYSLRGGGAGADDNSVSDSGGVTSEDLQSQQNNEEFPLQSNNNSNNNNQTIESENENGKSNTFQNDDQDNDKLQNIPILKNNVNHEDNNEVSTDTTDQNTSSSRNTTNSNANNDNNTDQEDDEKENDTNKLIPSKSSSSPSTSLSNMCIQEAIETKQNNVSNLRTQGKELHDDGDFQSAAVIFQKAASELDYIISFYHEHDTSTGTITGGTSTDSNNGSGSPDQQQEQLEQEQQRLHIDLFKINEERATCRLHEALCHLKNKDYAKSIVSCTDVLMDGVQIVSLSENEHSDDDGDDETNDQGHHQAVIERISSSNKNDNSDKSSPSSVSLELSPAVRARAYHRRAKARLALGDAAGALDDARSAAFLGDRNAVALYGKLMRESGSTATGVGSAFDNDMGSLGSLFSPPSSSSSPLQSLLSGDDSGMNTRSSFDFLSSMLSDQSSNGNSAANPFGSLGALGSLLNSSSNGSIDGAPNTGGMDSLAKSLLTSLTKRIEDESTQEMVCNYLNKVDASQISSLSSMAGVPLSSSVIDRIVGFSNGVTPKGMQKVIRLVKRLLFVGNVLRKTIQVIGKYKHLIVILMLIAWMKSAILRPVIVKAKAAKATAETLSKAATFII